MPAPRGDKWETDIERRLAQLEQRRPLANTGLTAPAPGVTQVDGQLVVQDGEARSGNYAAGVSGWRLRPDGTIEMNDAEIRGGIIGNDALTEPVTASVHKCSASNFSLNLTDTEKAGVNITVPAGFTQAQVIMSGRMYAINPNSSGGADTTGTDALYVRVGIAANYSTATPTGISGSNGFATTTCDEAFQLTGLTPGATIRLNALGSCAYQPIAASADNFISAVASISWLR